MLPPSTLVQSKERKGSNFAIWQPWLQSLQVTNRKKRVLVDDDDSEDDEGMVFFPEGGNGLGREDDDLEAASSNVRTESSHDLD